MSPWWVAFLDWHIRTDHEWDVALHLEAVRLDIEGVHRAIGEALAPVLASMAP